MASGLEPTWDTMAQSGLQILHVRPAICSFLHLPMVASVPSKPCHAASFTLLETSGSTAIHWASPTQPKLSMVFVSPFPVYVLGRVLGVQQL